MTLSSTAILIMARTGDAQQFGVPCQLRHNFSPQRLQSVIVWVLALLMTGEWAVDMAGEVITNGLFIVVMLAIFVCVGISFVEGVCVRSKAR